MSRVLLVGHGPLPHPRARHVGFPQVRTAAFLEALRAGGHDVACVLLQRPEAAAREAPEAAGDPAPSPLSADPEDTGVDERIARYAREFPPRAVVSAGPYDALRAAVLAAGDRPLWVDVPGDPPAEAQMKAHRLFAPPRDAHPAPEDPLQPHLERLLPALARGDAFSTCSRRQRLALVGQLGLLGRWRGATPGEEHVFAVPPPWGANGLAETPPRRRAPRSPLHLFLAGGFNTWLDGPGLWQGLLGALEGGADLYVTCTGGTIAGHHHEAYEAFRRAVAASRHRHRFTFPGWVPVADLPPLLRGAHATVNVDRPGYEPELGSRTRILFALHQGLAVTTTPLCELAEELAAQGWIEPVPPRDPEALTRSLLRDYARGHDGGRVAAAQRALRKSHDPRRLATPLLAWLKAPQRLGRGAPTPSGLEALARENSELRGTLHAIRRSPTWRLLDGLNRGLRGSVRRLESLRVRGRRERR